MRRNVLNTKTMLIAFNENTVSFKQSKKLPKALRPDLKITMII